MQWGRFALLVTVLVAATTSAVTTGASGAPIAGCRIFPANNQWNLPVAHLPVLKNSRAIVRNVGLDTGLHADFGSGLYQGSRIGIPYTVVPGHQKKVPIHFTAYGSESDPGPYPVPPDAPIEGGRKSQGDRHVVVVDRGNCHLYELYDAHPVNGGKSWKAGSGATWNLASNKLRPKTWTSADAAGLPILAGLARWSDARRGAIDHALRFTVAQTRKKFIYPARHYASSSTDPSLPAMGQRFRLRKGFDISGYPRQAQIVLRALKRYGMIVADNGSDWYISGAPNKHWNNDALHTLGNVLGKNFQVVDTSSLPRPGH